MLAALPSSIQYAISFDGQSGVPACIAANHEHLAEFLN